MGNRGQLHDIGVPFALSLAVAVVVCGCGGGGGGGSDNPPPTITNALAQTPQGFSFEGGVVTIQADVTDSDGVAEVTARVTRPDGTQDPTLVTIGLTQGATYSGTYDAPLNPRGDGQAETYLVVVSATDSKGAVSHSGSFSFEVPAETIPQPPPF